MSDIARPAEEREEIEMLLPWYVTGRLDPADATRVAAFLAHHPDMALQLQLIRKEQDVSISANESLGVTPAAALDRLMARLPSARPSLLRRIGLARRWEEIEAFFQSPSAPAVRWAAVAAAAVILVQFAAVGTLLVERNRETASFQTASGPDAEPGVVALVGFADHAPANAITRLLADFDASIVDGPKPGGIYKIRIRAADASEAAQRELLRRLAERRDLVRIVLPSSD